MKRSRRPRSRAPTAVETATVREPSPRLKWLFLVHRSDPHQYLAQPFPREEELHRLEIAKQFFQTSVIEQLHRRARAALSQLQRARFEDAERVTGDPFELVVRLEECQHLTLSPRDPAHLRNHRVQQSRCQILERVP